jgi:hypothetical protein
MDEPAVAAKQLVDLIRTFIEDEQCRIVWQRELIAEYERYDDVARLPGARFVLERMQKQLDEVMAVRVAAEGLLSKLTVTRPASRR